MRLVITYTSGDGYTYHCDNVVPVNYESAEQLAVDLEAAVLSYIERQDSYVTKVTEFHKKNPNRNAPNWSVLWMAFYTEHNVSSTEKFPLKGYESCLWLTNFVEEGKYVAPQIYTVDEWFTSNGLE